MGEFHPVQVWRVNQDAQIPADVTRRAYEVYAHVYGEQPAMVDLAGSGCRGGFSVGELLAFLYARSFPQEEWGARVNEAFQRPERSRS